MRSLPRSSLRAGPSSPPSPTAELARPFALTALAVSVPVFLLAAGTVSGQRFLPGEAPVLEAANRLGAPLGAPLRAAMVLGTVTAFAVAACITAWVTRREGPWPTVAVLVALLGATVLDDAWKVVIERPRPSGVLDAVDVRADADGFGFPSGHTTMACALAAVLHPLLPRRARPLAWALAVSVGVARMHVGVHWPMDVVGGVALGLAVGAAAWLVAGQGRRWQQG